MRKQIYQALASHIQALSDDQGYSLFRHIDLWNNNLLYVEEQTYALPALFIEFMPISWRPMTQGYQQATLSIRFHLVVPLSSPTAYGSLEIDQALAVFDLSDALHSSLYRWKMEGTRHLTRTSSITDNDHQDVIDAIELYELMVFDPSALRAASTPIEASIAINKRATS